MALRAVLFDLDGTLVDSAPAIASALSRLRADRGAPCIEAATVRGWVSLGAVELVRRALAGVPGETVDDLALFRNILHETPTPLESVYPGVRDLLSHLHCAGLKLAVVTNKPEGLAHKLLTDLELNDLFKAVIGGDSTQHAKPDPAPLLAALTILETQPCEAVMVGDSAIDAEAAASLAMPFHLFEGGYGAKECDGHPIATRFDNPVALLSSLLPSAQAVT